ncbi:MAG: phosphatidylserine decarboxylase [Candidatus Eremiobacteraeota bacterium]|nr:phosphatidylserine decarboxylase [Candidatus Eremiobacteraeota bacterium]
MARTGSCVEGVEVTAPLSDERDIARGRHRASYETFMERVLPNDLPSRDVLSEGYYAAVNTRGLVFVESDDPVISMVRVIPIGITEISSVTIEVAIGQKLAKGDELGCFSYGGSSLCLVFKQGAINEFTMGDPPPKPVTDPTSGPAVEVNAQIAIAN